MFKHVPNFLVTLFIYLSLGYYHGHHGQDGSLEEGADGVGLVMRIGENKCTERDISTNQIRILIKIVNGLTH